MILLLDNYDSFVHNLARYLRQLGADTLVLRSDRVDRHECQRLAPDAVVLSPGPKGPFEAGCSVDVVRTWTWRSLFLVSVLGIRQSQPRLVQRSVRVLPGMA